MLRRIKLQNPLHLESNVSVHLLRSACILLLVLSSHFLSSCSPRNNSRKELPIPKNEFRLGRGDVINVRFRYWPEMNDTQRIRPDGMIAMSIVGAVVAAGSTPEELKARLEDLYASHVRDPEITVVSREILSQRVYVGGEVLNPGALPLIEGMTVMQAIMAAGGFNKLGAKLSNVIVIRHIDGERYATAFDLKNGFIDETSEPMLLYSNDVVYVPRTRIDELNQWMDQHIQNILNGIQITPTRIKGHVGYDGLGGN